MYEKIEQLLKERNISRMQLAMKAGINPPDLYNALNGIKPMYPAYKKRISRALKVKESELFGSGDGDE